MENRRNLHPGLVFRCHRIVINRGSFVMGHVEWEAEMQRQGDAFDNITPNPAGLDALDQHERGAGSLRLVKSEQHRAECTTEGLYACHEQLIQPTALV